MTLAGFALFLNAQHYYATTDHGEAGVDVAVPKAKLTRALLWQFATMITGFGLALISFIGLIIKAQ